MTANTYTCVADVSIVAVREEAKNTSNVFIVFRGSKDKLMGKVGSTRRSPLSVLARPYLNCVEQELCIPEKKDICCGIKLTFSRSMCSSELCTEKDVH